MSAAYSMGKRELLLTGWQSYENLVSLTEQKRDFFKAVVVSVRMYKMEKSYLETTPEFFAQILEATSHKTAVVWLLAENIMNHPSKTKDIRSELSK